MAVLGREVVNAMLFGPSSEGRLVHDSPVRGDVWAALAAAPGHRIEVLVEAYRNLPAGQVASRLADRLYRETAPRLVGDDREIGFGISFVQGFIAARIGLGDLIHAILPFTAWTRELHVFEVDPVVDVLGRHVEAQLLALQDAQRMVLDSDPRIGRLAATFRILAALAWAAEAESGRVIETLPDFFAAVLD